MLKKVIIKENEVEQMIKDGGVVLGSKVSNNKKSIPVILPFKDRFLHTLIVGPTGSGKASQMIMPMINQDLQNKNVGITLIEPKGDLSDSIYMLAKYYGREVVHFNPILPDCPYLNIFDSKEEDINNLLILSFDSILSKKIENEKAENEEFIRKSVKIIKEVYGETATFNDFNNLINNVDNKAVEIIRAFSTRYDYQNTEIESMFLKDYLVNENNNKYKELQEIINKIAVNKYLGRVLNPKKESVNTINFDKVLEEGTVLIFNSAQGSLRDLGYYLGQFIVNKYSISVFNRKGTDLDRKPNMCYIDEYQVYLNKSITELLTIGRSYRVSMNLSIQTNKQLEDNKKLMNMILSNTRNKIVFPGLCKDDAEYYGNLFSDYADFELIRKESSNKKLFNKDSLIKKENKEQFSITNMIYRPFGQATYSILINNQLSSTGVLKISYIERELDKIINDMLKEHFSKYIK